MGAESTSLKPSRGAVSKLRIVTKFPDPETFAERFAKFVFGDGMFVVSKHPRSVGSKLPFVVELMGGAPMLEGQGEVVDVQQSPKLPPDRIGMRLKFLDLTQASRDLIDKMMKQNAAAALKNAARAPTATTKTVTSPLSRLTASSMPAATPSSPAVRPPTPNEQIAKKTLMGLSALEKPPAPRQSATPTSPGLIPPPGAKKTQAMPAATPPSEQRTPGSALIVPANPFMGMENEALEGFIDCTLFEDTSVGFDPTESTNVEPDPAPQRGGERKATGPKDALLSGEAASWLDKSAPVTKVNAETDHWAPPTVEPWAPPGSSVAKMVMEEPSAPVQVPAPMTLPTSPSQPPLDAALGRGNPDYNFPLRAPEDLTTRVPPRRPRSIAMIVGVSVAVALLVGLGIGYMVFGGKKASQPAVAENPPATTPAAGGTPPADPGKTTPGQPAVAAGDPEPDNEPDTEPDEPPDNEPIVPAGEGNCTLKVTTDPSGASVRIGRKKVGKTPASIDSVECGKELSVIVSRARYAKQSAKIVAEPNKPAELAFKLERPIVKLTLTSVPAGANVKVDGKPAGKTPITTEVKGFHNVRVTMELPGYKTYSTKKLVKARATKISKRLDSARGSSSPKKPGKFD